VKQMVRPIAGGPAEVLVRTPALVISPDVARIIAALAQARMLTQGRARLHVVRRVIREAFTRSYGPDRHEPSYEAEGMALPVPHMRWIEGGDFEAILDLPAAQPPGRRR
jgi:hypothetical protein